jgi:hypothetical protein
MTTAFRSFEVLQTDPRIDLALLTLDGTPVAPSPLRVVSGDYTPVVGEPVELCGYAHGSVLLKRGKETYRLGPVVQAGIIEVLGLLLEGQIRQRASSLNSKAGLHGCRRRPSGPY